MACHFLFFFCASSLSDLAASIGRGLFGYSYHFNRISAYENGSPFLTPLAKLLRHARVEILVLIRAEPDKIDPSSDSSNERCIQQPPEDASSPSNRRPTCPCRKPNACG